MVRRRSSSASRLVGTLFYFFTSLAARTHTHVRAQYSFVVFTGDVVSDAEIIQNARDKFGVSLSESSRIRFVRLSWRELCLKPRGRFTMLLQFLGGGLLTLEALFKFPVDVFIDSTGVPLSYPTCFALLPPSGASILAFVSSSVPIVSYTHYPTISSDMLDMVFSRRPSYNNAADVSSSLLKTRTKYVYYRAFALLYRFCGLFPTLVMCNSTWTRDHLERVFCSSGKLVVVFPPCGNMEELFAVADEASKKKKTETTAPGKKRRIVSVGQFRPEKDHRLQLRGIPRGFMLTMIGGVRNEVDEQYVSELAKYAKNELGLSEGRDFEFRRNVSKKELLSALVAADVVAGVHTMWNEHFGIGIVEMMACGVVVVAHDSGGPKSDIVDVGSTGYLCGTADEYRAAFKKISEMNPQEIDAVKTRAREGVARFDDDVFRRAFFDGVVRALPG